jgi:hypothetical protein
VRALLEEAAAALHRIASSNQAKRIIAAPGKLTEPMLASMKAKVMTEEEVDRLCLDTFERIAIELGGGDRSTQDPNGGPKR